MSLPPGQSLRICGFTCLIFAFPNQVLIIFLVLGLFENLVNRLAGINRVLSTFPGLTDQTDPNIGFRLYKFWVTHNLPNGPDGTQFWVPPVYSQGAASTCRILFFVFNISTPKHQNTILLARYPLPAMCLAY